MKQFPRIFWGYAKVWDILIWHLHKRRNHRSVEQGTVCVSNIDRDSEGSESTCCNLPRMGRRMKIWVVQKVAISVEGVRKLRLWCNAELFGTSPWKTTLSTRKGLTNALILAFLKGGFIALTDVNCNLSWPWCARSSTKVLTWWRWGWMGGGDIFERPEKVVNLSISTFVRKSCEKQWHTHTKSWSITPVVSARKGNTFLKLTHFIDIIHRAKPDFTPDGWEKCRSVAGFPEAGYGCRW